MKLILKNILPIVTCASFAVCSSSFADDASKNQQIAERFAKCDTNHDGKLTLAEAKGCMPRIYDHFSYIDSANKGYLTVAEIQAVADR
jgi:Ca2+-binding EF-hand superfamily protein